MKKILYIVSMMLCGSLYLCRLSLHAQTPWQQDSIRFFELWWEFAEEEATGKVSDKLQEIKKEGLALSQKLLAEKFDSTIYTMHVSHYFGLSLDHLALGNVEEALLYSDTAIQKMIDVFGRDYIGLENYYIARCAVTFEKEDYDQTIALNQQMLQLINKHQTDSVYWFDFDSLVFQWHPYNHQFHVSKYHSNMAKIYEDMGKLHMAKKHNQAFLDISTELGVPAERLISGMDRKGSIHLLLGEYAAAEKVFTEIQQLVEEKMGGSQMANLYANLRMANVYAYMGRESLVEKWLEGFSHYPTIAK